MDTNTSFVMMTRPRAAFPAACSARGTLSVLGPNHALGQLTVLAAGVWPMQAPAATTPKQLAAAPAGERLTAIGTRKQNVNPTRISAGGYGAMGPHPEREPA